MITDKDITKLKKTFATKSDIKDFAKKKDLTRFATKDELREEIAGVRLEIGEVQDTVDKVALAVGRIENAVDGLAGAIQGLRTENSMGYIHLTRHDRQIEALAIAAKVALPN